jgi:drug/metabolite transporter (DMT)-like permease
MSVSWIAVALVTGVALSFSGLDVLRKLLAERVKPLPLLVLLSAGSWPVFVLWAVIEGDWTVSGSYVVPGLVSILLNVGANLAFLEAVRVSPLSLTIPYLSLTPVFATLLSIPILGERPAPLQAVGIVLVVIGAFWLQAPADGRSTLHAVFVALARERGSLLMILTALCWSLAAPLDKLAIGASSPLFHAVVMMGGISICGVAILASRSQLAELRVRRSTYGLVGLSIGLTAVGLIMNFVALRLVWVGFVETGKRALGSALALLWGRTIFSEPLGVRKLAAVALMGVGVGLILW